MTLIVTSFDASITGDELKSAVQLPNFRLTVAWRTACMMCAIYNARLALFHGITSAKRTRDLQPVVLVGESSMQLAIYLLDTCIGYSTYLLIIKSQKSSMEALNFLIIASYSQKSKLLLGM